MRDTEHIDIDEILNQKYDEDKKSDSPDAQIDS